MTTLANGEQLCVLCLSGPIIGTHSTPFCITTHTPWKNCGVECCVEEVNALEAERIAREQEEERLPNLQACPWCPVVGTPAMMAVHIAKHENTDGVASQDEGILREIAAERRRQDDKWGEQNHQDGTGGAWTMSVTPFNWRVDSGAQIAELAKRHCERRARAGDLTFLDIALEEMAEAFAETDPAKLRAELVQAAAVVVNWLGAIDRRAYKEKEKE